MKPLIHFTLIAFFAIISSGSLSAKATNDHPLSDPPKSTNAAEEFYRVENFKNPKFIKLDNAKAKSFLEAVDGKIEEQKKLGRKVIFPKKFNIKSLDYEVYAIKMEELRGYKMMKSVYQSYNLMDPTKDQYYPMTSSNEASSSEGLPSGGNDLRGNQNETLIILKADGLNPQKPSGKLINWVKRNLDGMVSESDPKLKLNVSANNELSLCLDMGNTSVYKEQEGKLVKIRSLNVNQNMVAFSQGAKNKYCVITSDGSSNNTNAHFFRARKDALETKKIKIWDEYPQDNLKEMPYPTLDYANGEFLFQYYIHMSEGGGPPIHSGSFRTKIKNDGTAGDRTWQTGHTFGMDALHNGKEWVSLYSTDGDYVTNHSGLFIDKVDKREKALLFSAPQKWDPSSIHGAINYFYTGLGGIAYDQGGYAVVFNNPKIKTAPSSLPQNVGFVYVKEAFEPTTRRRKEDLSPVDPTSNLLNGGATDDVTVYTWTRNTSPVNYKRKVAWLSDYGSIEEGFAKNPDIVAIGDKFVVVWEKWAKVREEKDRWGPIPVWEFKGTESVVINNKGQVVIRKSLGKHPLNNWDDVHVQNGKAVWATFDNGTFYINKLDPFNLGLTVKEIPLP